MCVCVCIYTHTHIFNIESHKSIMEKVCMHALYMESLFISIYLNDGIR
jgi:hypothetical protein